MGKASVNNYEPGLSGTNTTQIGGSRFPFWDGQGLTPAGFGPILANAPFAVPSVPPSYGQGGSTQTNPDTSSALSAAGAPFSLTQSPLVWVIIAALGSLYAVHHVHWQGK